MTDRDPQPEKRNRLVILGRVAALLLLIGISAAVFMLGDDIERLKSLGYLGAFLIMLVGNATVILPAPGITLVFALGSSLNPILVGLASGAGAVLGEFTGYLAGYSGTGIVENRKLYKRFESWMDRYGLVALLVLAAFPNPFFDIVGILAGVLRITWWRFLLATWVGKTIQGILFAYAGLASADWVLSWLD